MNVGPILVLDSDPSIRGLLAEWLETAGYTVEQAQSFQTAVIRLGAHPFALIITEVAMPKQGSGPVVGWLRSEYPDIPVIAICTRFCGDQRRAVAAAKELGVAQLLGKPFSREDVVKAVAAVAGPAVSAPRSSSGAST
jgi:CheY-like chemotaxis protein